MVPKIGFEPTSYFQLPLAPFVAERDTWALNLELRVRIELTTSGWKPDTLPLRQRSTNLFIVATLRDYDTPTFAVTVRRSSSELQGLKLVGDCGYAPLPITDRFYRPIAETIDFNHPYLFLPHQVSVCE